ncbi:hypothetical protein [Streptomyces sp. NPDC048350]|uniref:hypothetical protein n=1 Tax=Streptomyces sp. NPDC048350 TaxID=3365538 RepID=UPI003724B87D
MSRASSSLGRDAAQFRVAPSGCGAAGLFLHGQDHCLASALEGAEGVASRVGRYRFRDLDSLGQLPREAGGSQRGSLLFLTCGFSALLLQSGP